MLGVEVPGAGLEPARAEARGILSPLRLPIPPPGRCRNLAPPAARWQRRRGRYGIGGPRRCPRPGRPRISSMRRRT